jgi:GAF domain-containing protein
MTASQTPEATRTHSRHGGTRAAGQQLEAVQPYDLEAGQPFDAGQPYDAARQQVDGAWLARELAGLTVAVNREHADEAAVLSLITAAAMRLIPGADGAAIVVPASGPGLEIRAARGDLPRAVAELQLELGAGPCLDAGTWTGQILLPDTAADSRWPTFGERAAAIGARGIACTPLVTDGSRFGILLLVSKSAGALGAPGATLAAAFAAHASLALAGAEARRQFSVALSGRDVIGQAKGILMERFRMTADAAFALLAGASQETNTKLRDVAGELCRTGSLPAPARTGRAPASRRPESCHG